MAMNVGMSHKESDMVQKIIVEEINQSPKVTSLQSIFDAIRERFQNKTDRSWLDSMRDQIFGMIETTLCNLGFEPKNAIEHRKENVLEPAPVKSKNRKGENVGTNQLVLYDRDSSLASKEQTERDQKELNEVLQQSRIDHNVQMEFDRQLNETLVKSYQEEKSKLLTMLTAEDFSFEDLADQLNKILPNETSVAYKGKTMIDRSALILAIIELFELDSWIIKARPVQDHIKKFGQRCLSIDSKVVYQDGIHQKSIGSAFNVGSINDFLVNIEIKGDGNCMWAAISHSLVGDYAMMESLRLLTAYALMHYSEQFLETLKRQVIKFGYNALTLEQLIKTSVSLQSWGDEFHLVALSLALKRPIYSYGSLIDIPECAFMSYEQFREIYEIESFPNHFKFIGDANDAKNEPILLHYDGYSHYSSVLKRSESIKPLVPHVQVIDALIGGSGGVHPDEPEKLIDIDSDMADVAFKPEVEREGIKSNHIPNQRDARRSDEIEKLKNYITEKDVRLGKHESFFRDVKEMVDSENFDLRKLRHMVDVMDNSRKQKGQ